MNIFVRVLFLLPLGGSVFAAMEMLDMFTQMNTVKGITYVELSGRVAFAIALAAVPYVTARSVQEMVK